MIVHVCSISCCQEELAYTDSTLCKGLDSTLYFVSSLDWFFSRRDLFRVTTQSCSVVFAKEFFNLLTVSISVRHADIGTALHVTTMFSMSLRWTELPSWRKVVYQTLSPPSALWSVTPSLHDPAVSWRTFHPASSLRLLSRRQYYASSYSVLQDPASLLSPKTNRPPLQSHTLWPGIYRVCVFCFPFGRAILCRSLLSIHKHFLQQSFFFKKNVKMPINKMSAAIAQEALSY